MRHTNAAIAVVSVTLVGVVVYWESGRLTSPGALHPSHASVHALRGSSGCVACHGDDQRTMAEACIECHEAIGDQMARATGIHGTLDSTPAAACQVCHIEHTGAIIGLVSKQTFALADIADARAYRHQHVQGFGLGGSHDALACELCHKAANAVSVPEGTPRFLGLSQACTACHEDVHKGAYGTDCASCHGQDMAFDSVAAFEHTVSFPLIGSHAGLSCKSCHAEATPYEIVDMKMASAPGSTSCADCHTSPHDAKFLAEVAAELKTSSAHTCAECHRVEHASFLYPEATVSPALHKATGFPLAPPHASQECSQCHAQLGRREQIADAAQSSAIFAAAFPGRPANECRACHGDPHGGQFDIGGKAAQCLSCHDSGHFVPSTFDAARHARTKFRLTGAHVNAGCADCHTDTNGVQRFAGTSMECSQCHEDPHGGQFASQPYRNDCSACHDTNHFEPTLFDLAKHQATRFPLLGAHEAVACRTCHTDGASVRQFTSTASECSQCHEDVHKGAFDGPKSPVVVDGRRGCARCHSSESFDVVGWISETHESWTGYALAGAHARATCAECHGPRPGSTGATGGFASTSRQCASCHADPHAGQFVLNGTTDCARCHTEQETFSQTIFDHQVNSNFVLDETHIGLACSQCHTPASFAGVQAIRYRPMGKQCQDCHGFEAPTN